jgi:pilus assembly protein CpaF
MMVGMAGFDLPIWTIRRQIASAINLVVQVSRLMGGPRKIIRISEIIGMDGDTLNMQDIFTFKQTGLDEARRVRGEFLATGIRPQCLERLEVLGMNLSLEMFEKV